MQVNPWGGGQDPRGWESTGTRQRKPVCTTVVLLPLLSSSPSSWAEPWGHGFKPGQQQQQCCFLATHGSGRCPVVPGDRVQIGARIPAVPGPEFVPPPSHPLGPWEGKSSWHCSYGVVSRDSRLAATALTCTKSWYQPPSRLVPARLV
jgi:hypothetical protein